MQGAMAESFAVALLLVSLGAAVARPLGVSEAVVAVPAAAIMVLAGIVSSDAALHTVGEIGPTVAFLAAILVFGHLCAEAGVFDYLGALAARSSRGRPQRLLVIVVALAAGVTAVLTLDATVVLLTPVVLTTARRLDVTPRPHAYACARLANTGSLLLPVSNLTNLLAFAASGLSFGRFAALTAAPWVVGCTAEWVVLRVSHRRELDATKRRAHSVVPEPPRYALTVLAATVVGFVLTSSVDVAPAWAAAAGCAALLVPRALRRDLSARRIIAEASPGFCAFVLALAVIVDAVTRHGLGDALSRLVPTSTGFVAMLGLVALAAVLANAVNNLPATLALLPVTAGQPALVLAVLLGVNIGPNAAYPGSLATLLWRRTVNRADRPAAGRFHAIGLLTVPALLTVTCVALWASVRLIGT